MADLTRDDGKLRFLTTSEAALIDALRADPDQERHIVDCHTGIAIGGYVTTVRHPISERLAEDALFACPVLGFAQAWLDDEEDPVGRWRLSAEGDYSYHEASFHRIEEA